MKVNCRRYVYEIKVHYGWVPTYWMPEVIPLSQFDASLVSHSSLLDRWTMEASGAFGGHFILR